ncbi:FHA domain-containing protein [Nocardioides limicola]|uniref:FHA domain-containing protein n=1 Tax=Nocardioides limicola TaxID=2803368 RepID=UPI00193B24A2|nr:FHA domain-containing protein [Nocardioides sp. DJM-14]
MNLELVTDPAAATSQDWAWRPGDWYAVIGSGTCALLPPEEKDRVARVWELVDAGEGFDEVLDALIASGLRQMRGFVLLGDSEGETRVVVRGPARAHFETSAGPVDVVGQSGTTWVEQVLTGVSARVIQVGASETDQDLRLPGGLVRVSRVSHPAGVSGGAAAAAEPNAEPTAEPIAEPAGEPEVDPSAETAADLPPHPDSDLPPPAPTLPAPVPQPAPTPPAPVAPPTPSPPTPSPAATEPQPEPAPEPAPDAEEDLEHDGMTRAGLPVAAEFPRTHPGLPGQPPVPEVTARPVAKLVISNGDLIDVDRVVIIGRAPEARRFTATEQPLLVAVPSPHQEISSTHLEVRPGSGADLGAAIVTDLGSTNGTVLVQPGLPPEDLRPGIAVQLIPGAVLDLGDSVTIQIAKP